MEEQLAYMLELNAYLDDWAIPRAGYQVEYTYWD